MINLLHASLPESEIAAILAASPARSVLPPLGHADWVAARDNPVWLKPLLPRALAEADEPLPILTDELYADFFKTGQRLPFENVYFERRRRLARAAMGVLLGDQATRARLTPSFVRKFGEVMDETSWTLPAHVWTEPTGRDPMQIDLFAAECANTFAELLSVFAAIIPADLAQRVKTRLRTQVFENYADRQPPFHWTTITNNWNSVCHQGVLGAAFAVEEDHALVARVLARAVQGLPAYLTGFGEDGSTSEGPGYWSYGFGWFSELNAQLEHRTGGKLSLFEGDAKIGRIARFAPLMTLSNGHMVNFSDGGRTGRLGPALLAYLGRRLDDPTLAAQGAALYRHLADTGLGLDDQRRDFFNLSRLALRVPAPAVIAAAREPVQPDVYFPDYGAIVARGPDSRGHLWEFSAKGGHNAEHHNHNDCGSYLLNIDGAPALVEIGAPEYTRAFFSDQRYTFLAARSLGHPVPFVNGREQPEGIDFAAAVLKAEIGGDRVKFAVDLAKCYPTDARCKTLRRDWLLEKSAGRLTITDTYELDASKVDASPGAIETMLICEGPVTRDGADALITTPRATLRVTPAPGTLITAVETCDYRGHQGTDEKIHRLRLAPAKPAASGTLGTTITLR